MNHLEFFKEMNAQDQIDKLVKKYKNKRVVIYGAGIYFQDLANNYDLSGLNVVGICDKKFENTKTSNTTMYTALSPNELNEIDFDIILIAVYCHIEIEEFLRFRLLINGKNHNKKLHPIIKPTFSYFLKTFLY